LIKLTNGKTRSYTCCDPSAFTTAIQALIDSEVSLEEATPTTPPKTYNAVGRIKENVLSSSWQYFEHDIDKHSNHPWLSLDILKYMLRIVHVKIPLSGIFSGIKEKKVRSSFHGGGKFGT
jgi:hypothetical protein